ncbi:MAG: Cell polarity [Lasallia pustulata]|uniref:Cell polarity n=1 Tax=Lasallia pustulata TaxID=136370 RepID=A0A5M8Q2Z3_9LECA|nr:MAG: Cell polarity [Lasallia pustulata]
MNGRSAALSPVSIEGSEWSGISRYQAGDSPGPSSLLNSRGNLVTPPISGSSNGLHSINGMGGVLSQGRNGGPGNSPPSSIARSSNATNLSVQSRKAILMEESLSMHYTVLRRYLAQSLRDEKGNAKPNRARDKLLRLSPVQFQELSTDVYDELLRRQNATGPQRGGQGEVPTYLLPKENFHPKRNQARQKLSTLPAPRFRDLATDVFYELERRFPKFAAGDIERIGSPASVRRPPSRQGTPNGIRPGSRDQATPRGSGFPPRQVSVGGQPITGLGIPGVGGPDDAYGRPQAKTFQSNTIIPNKSTLVEDDDEQTGPEDSDDDDNGAPKADSAGSKMENGRVPSQTTRDIGGANVDKMVIADYEARIGELQRKVNDLERKLLEKDIELERVQGNRRDNESADGAERKEWADIRSALEGNVANALNLNSSLQSELERVRSQHAGTERNLRSQIAGLSRSAGGDDEWRNRYDNLEREHRTLQTELLEQQQVTNEVKEEASAFLNEMKVLSDRSDQTWEREEKLVHQVHRLEEEVKEWRSRYARTKTQLRTLRASSVGLSIPQPEAGKYAKDGVFTQQDGLIKDIHVTKFQIAIDELLRCARVGEPETVLDHVKPVVVSVRLIIQDIGDKTSSDDALSQQKIKSRTRVSATANNVITACKNFAASNGLSPVSLLDAAASHLTTAVVELIRTAKIRPTPTDELEEEDSGSPSSEAPAYFPIHNARRASTGEDSIHSAPSPPSNQSKTQTQTLFSTPQRPSSHNGLANGPSHPSSATPNLASGTRAHDAAVAEPKLGVTAPRPS